MLHAAQWKAFLLVVANSVFAVGVSCSLSGEWSGVSATEARVVRPHWGDSEATQDLESSISGLKRGRQVPIGSASSVAKHHPLEEESDEGRVPASGRQEPNPGEAFIEEWIEAGAAGGFKTGDVASCEITFPEGYRHPPTIKVTASAPLPEPVTAVMLDESASFWLHGHQTGVRVPSVFIFGSAPEGEGDFVAFHPPTGTGKHAYTLILYQNATQIGDVLASLAGTPWNNQDRALKSVRAVEEDLHEKNRQYPKELCRCSIYVAQEDIQESS